MASPEPAAGFTLTYQLTADDLKDTFAVSPELGRRRARYVRGLAISAVLAMFFTALAITQAQTSGGLSTFGLPLLWWALILTSASALWRLSPTRLARATLHAHGQAEG